MSDYRLLHGDCLDLMKAMDAESVDSIVTDPPYGLSFMGKDWDAPSKMLGLISRGHEQRGAYAYGGTHSRGYFDHDSIAFQSWCLEWALEALRVAKPGSHLLAFGGTRTFHRLAVAIEDAGWEIRDCVMWVYGSGFPKSLDVSKAIDKTAGAERNVIGVNLNGRPAKRKGGAGFDSAVGGHPLGEMAITAPATDAARQWHGWGTALKPAWEPIIVARKPLCGTVAENVLTHGTGAINVDGCRVGTEDMSGQFDREWNQDGTFGNGKRASQGKQCAPGRWPANLIHDGSEQTTDLMGSAARFFYCAKASKSDRGDDNDHPTVKPTDLMQYLCRLVTPPGGTVLDPFMGSGSTGKGAVLEGFKFVGCEKESQYVEIARKRIESVSGLFAKEQ